MRPATSGAAGLLLVAALALAACTEKPQTSTRKADAGPYQGATGTHNAGGWKPGDKAGWEEAMRVRAQAQNEYNRSSSAN